MEYPFWYVPVLGSPMLIPVVALPHVLVAHFAVGGGLLLWLGIRRAQATGDAGFLSYLHRLTRFFVLITVVFGAITGVGIWWTIGLTSPQATSTLIHAFIFGWAAEWVTFLVELVAALGLFYLWHRLGARGRVSVAGAYAVAAWLSLVLITGITSFMLSTGRWPETYWFWHGFLNPTFLPSVVARTGGSLALAALYIFLHVSVVAVAADVRLRVVDWASRWALYGILLIFAGGFWWFLASPAYVQHKVFTEPVMLIITVVSIGATVTLTAAVAFGPVPRAHWLVPPLAGVLFMLGATGLSSGEFVREAGRKPYTVQNYLYSNGLLVNQVDQVRAAGYLNSARWARLQVQAAVPQLFDEAGLATAERAALLPESQRLQVGEVIYEYQCGVCHARVGYNGILPRLAPATRELVGVMVRRTDELSSAMPPWVGHEWEADAVADFLYTAAGSNER